MEVEMPGCVLPDTGEVITVASCDDCAKSYSGGCLEDAPGGVQVHISGFCFVRNVLVRTLADILLDIGASQQIDRVALDSLNLASAEISLSPGNDEMLALTPEIRTKLTQEITGGIAQLASTYMSTIHFRDDVLLKGGRGRELKAIYDHSLHELYRLASRNLRLFHQTATTWFVLHPFVEAMVREARRTPGSGDQVFTADLLKRCKALLHNYSAASKNNEFRNDLREISEDLDAFEGLSASEAVSALHSLPQRHKGSTRFQDEQR